MNKNPLRLLVAALVVGQTATLSLGAQSCTAPPSGLVAWWSGDGHFFDLVGTNHGTPAGGVTYAAGEVGRAFTFATTNDWVRFTTSHAILTQTVGTVEFWVKILSLEEDTVRLFSVSQADVAFPDSDQWAIDYRNVAIAPGAIQVSLAGIAGGSGPAGIIVNVLTPAGTISDTHWHHIAVVADGVDPIEVYVDGAAKAATGFFGSTDDRFFGHAPNVNAMAGGAIIRDSVYAEGVKQIDELCIYNRALSASEIAAIHAAGSAGKCKPPVALPDGCVDWWSGDGHFFDLVGGNTGTPQSGVSFGPGAVGLGFVFNGMDGYVSCSGPTDLNASSGVSIELWMRTADFVEFAGLVDKMQAPGRHYTGFKVGLEGYGCHVLRTDFGRGDGYVDDYLTATNSAVVTDGNWHHVVSTYDGTKAILYVDGVPGPAVPGTGYLTTNSQPVILGWDHSETARFFKGSIDEVAVYSRALNSNEIAAIYAAGSAGKTPPARLQILGPQWSNGNLVFSFATVSNRSYTVQFNDDLATTNWLFYTDLTGNGGLMGFATRPSDSTRRYFRVRQP